MNFVIYCCSVNVLLCLTNILKLWLMNHAVIKLNDLIIFYASSEIDIQLVITF